MLFVLPLSLRTEIWESGFGGVNCAIRYAAIELDLYFPTHTASLSNDATTDKDTSENFLAWADSALVGINDAVKRAGDESTRKVWSDLGQHPLRQLMREMRHQALKQRSEVIGWEYQHQFADGGFVVEEVFQLPLAPGAHMPVLGTSNDYLHWIRDEALSVLARTIRLGARGDDLRRSDEMPFARSDPWSTRLEPEPILLLEGVGAE